jgi:hypothetical protein
LADLKIEVGEVATVPAVAAGKYGEALSIETVAVSVDSPSVAVVSKAGPNIVDVTGLAVGTATVSVGDKAFTVEVSAPAVVSVEVAVAAATFRKS